MDRWSFYSREALSQVEWAKLSWNAFLDAEQRQHIDEIFFHLQHYLGHAALVDKILDPPEGSERRNVVASNLNLTNIDLKVFRRLRNHLEHFDERLDRWISEHKGWAFFDKNLVTRTTGFPREASLRALDAHVFKFQGEEYDRDHLYKQLLEIELQLAEETK